MRKTLLLLTFIVVTLPTVLLAQHASMEMLVSLPLLTDKNAQILSDNLKSTSGVESIEVCYKMNVVIIHFDATKNTEENILESIRASEINSTAELKFSHDINYIRQKYHLESIPYKPDREK